MKPKARSQTPVIRDLRTLFSESLPRNPVIIHMAENEWEKLSDGIPISENKIRPDAKGVLVMKDPFGGYLGFFACALGSGEGVACIPEIVRSGDTITFGRGCFCIRGRDVVEVPVASEAETCSLGISSGRFTCSGTCSRGTDCRLVKGFGLGGRLISITCECS